MSNHDAPPADPDAPPADPDELDFTNDESVVEIGEARYVVGTDGRPNVGGRRPSRTAADAGSTAAESANPTERQPEGGAGRARNAAGNPDPAGTAGRPGAGGAGTADAAGGAGSSGGAGTGVDRQAVSRWLANSFDNDGFDYGIDATLHADGETSRQRMASNDVTATFETLITWFASNAGPNSPTPEALGLLLVASETTVDLPSVVIERFAARHGLTASDSIGDLVRAAEDADGFRIE